MEKETYVVTSALPYVNGVKHIGNVTGSLLPADVFTRFLRLEGHDAIYICGTDEHGAPTEIAALKAGRGVGEFCRENYELQKRVYEGWNLSFDHFGRTSGAENHATTTEIFNAANKNKFVSQAELQMPYCEKDGRFLPDRFIEGECPNCGYDGARGDQCEKCGKVLDPIDLKNPRCNVCGGRDIAFKTTKHLFLDLNKLSDKLKIWITTQGHWPDNARNFALQWIKDGLKPRCITRDLTWGVKVPLEGFEDKVFYVWFDAPIGYISFTKEWAKKAGRNWEDYWRNPKAKIVHFLGKDNVAFHTVIWPGMLIASGYSQLPHMVRSYEFLNLEGKKFSTSRNWGINSDEALDMFPADYWRYYLTSILPEHSDSDFSFTEFQKAVNSDLNDTIGNLANRCLTFIKANYGGNVPAPQQQGEWSESSKQFAKAISENPAIVAKSFHEYKLQQALRDAVDLARQANKFFNDGAPWKKCKGSEREQAEAKTTLYLTCRALAALSVTMSPFIPASAAKLRKYLGIDAKKANWGNCGNLECGNLTLEGLAPLFTKIEDKQLETVKGMLEARMKK